MNRRMKNKISKRGGFNSSKIESISDIANINIDTLADLKLLKDIQKKLVEELNNTLSIFKKFSIKIPISFLKVLGEREFFSEIPVTKENIPAIRENIKDMKRVVDNSIIATSEDRKFIINELKNRFKSKTNSFSKGMNNYLSNIDNNQLVKLYYIIDVSCNKIGKQNLRTSGSLLLLGDNGINIVNIAPFNSKTMTVPSYFENLYNELLVLQEYDESNGVNTDTLPDPDFEKVKKFKTELKQLCGYKGVSHVFSLTIDNENHCFISVKADFHKYFDIFISQNGFYYFSKEAIYKDGHIYEYKYGYLTINEFKNCKTDKWANIEYALFIAFKEFGFVEAN